jgi:hypothetical protein
MFLSEPMEVEFELKTSSPAAYKVAANSWEGRKSQTSEPWRRETTAA